MRESIEKDPNNVDRIGSPDNPGLKCGTLTRAQHRDRLAGKYRGGEQALGTPDQLESLLDSLYGPRPKEE